ncbi:YfhO family protein [Flavihumibacter sp. CACIAM 22H1]|uniref:YfhO family protein n=1 Tax=Flavihumibacter sp. CACIAM 22H1 TaxID=1812911 RepID=UPI0007A8F7F1|nr:YfhO family protein [Flavihumibacter sp. CACIAM 22H1]KYP14002.1 MAG: hypothetical protein A1D16_02665 [Flavihumibacter sp. CACIAM 22H1]
MNSAWFKKAAPHIYAILAFLLVSIIYCQPALTGKVLDQHDTLGWLGMAQQSFEFKEKFGYFPLWTNSMFGGMPAFAIAFEGTVIQTIYLQNILTLWMPVPIGFFFLACISFYFLGIVFRLKPLIAAMAAIAFAWSTYDPVIIAVGHNTKMWAIAYMPAVIASILLIFQRKYLLGAGLLALFFGLQTSTQHIQMVYYTAIIMACISIAYLVSSIRKKELKPVFTGFGVAIVSAALGIASYAISWYPLQDYSKETMRGGRSEITMGKDASNRTKGGLDKDYAFGWSYGIGETLTFMVPSIYGGSSRTVIAGEAASEIGENSKVAEVLQEKTGMSEEQANELSQQIGNTYWGEQPSTSGPVYFGAIICALFILGLFYVQSWHKGWLVAAIIIGTVLAWGKNFSSINYFLFDYLPLYNKFRAPTIAMVIPQLCFPLLAALGLQQFLEEKEAGQINWKKFKSAGMALALVLVLFIGFYFMADYSSGSDAYLKEQLAGMMAGGQQQGPEMQQQAQSFAQTVIRALEDDRQSLYGKDLIRALVLIGLSIGLLYYYAKDKLSTQLVLIGILCLSSFDILSVGRRYLSSRNFVEPEEFENGLQATPADLQIKQDTRYPYRVFDRSTGGNPFESARASYFHNSIGGYSPAKLGLYQDLIEHQLSKGNMQVYNMLNTRYFIMQNPADGKPVAQQNPAAFGPVWLVKEIMYVPDGDAEMKALDSTDLLKVAVVQEKFRAAAGGAPVADSAASITWLENKNDLVSYKSSASTPQFAVFSEIFYDKGWNAYIDGKLVPHVKTNYLLRGLAIPAGQHSIEFRFEPKAVALSKTITTVSTILLAMLLLAGMYTEIKSKKAI